MESCEPILKNEKFMYYWLKLQQYQKYTYGKKMISDVDTFLPEISTDRMKLLQLFKINRL